MKTITSHNILAAYARMEGDLPALLEDQWTTKEHILSAQVEKIRNETDSIKQSQLSLMLIDMISPYPEARQHLQTNLSLISFLKDIFLHNLNSHSKLALDANQLDNLSEMLLRCIKTDELSDTPDSERYITLKSHGLGKAKSIKFANLEIDFQEMSELIAGTVTTGYGIVEDPNPMLIIAGILIVISSFTKAMTIELTEQETSVFWGFVNARDPQNNSASEKSIMKHTNKERLSVGLAILKKTQVKNSLFVLESLKCVECLDTERDLWRLVEKYRVSK